MNRSIYGETRRKIYEIEYVNEVIIYVCQVDEGKMDINVAGFFMKIWIYMELINKGNNHLSFGLRTLCVWESTSVQVLCCWSTIQVSWMEIFKSTLTAIMSSFSAGHF